MKLLKLLLKTVLLVSITALCARTGNAQAQCGLPGIIYIQYKNNRATCPAGGPNATYVILGENNIRQATFQCTADTNVQPPPNAGTVYASYSEPNPFYAFGDLYCNYNSAYSTYECPPLSDVTFTEATSPSDYNRFYNREYSFEPSGGQCPQTNFIQDIWQCNGLACQPPPPPPDPCCNHKCFAKGNKEFNGATLQKTQLCCTCDCPIIIDTSGNGFNLTSAVGGVQFDMSGTQSPEQMAWTASDSGNAFLCLPDANGRCDDGKYLFGNFTPQPATQRPNGYLALAVYDLPVNGGNGDGLIDSQDAVYSRLRLWIDRNHDGISQPDEIYTLPSLGVYSISLNYKEDRRTDQYGNLFRFRSQVNVGGPAGSVARTIYDVFLLLGSNSLTAQRACPAPQQPRLLPEGKDGRLH